jgi:pyruvate dehydrogenase E2 component (dihydrolipoamide acetyltransferase)
MTQIAYFNLPDVGEGLTEAEIVSWKVKPGDTVSVNQVIVEIETAKSLVELQANHFGYRCRWRSWRGCHRIYPDY